MKRKLAALTVLTVALILTSAIPRGASANNWPNDFGQCVDQYAGGWFPCWDTAWGANDNCDLIWPPNTNPTQNSQCKADADSDKLTCLSGYSMDFANCTGQINYGFEEIDFCTNARIAASMCNSFSGPDDFDAYYNCLASSGVSNCE